MAKKEVDVVASTIKPAVDFVRKIQPGDKVIIAHGHDNDTICSAVVMQRLLRDLRGVDAALFPLEDNFAVREGDVGGMERLKPDFIVVVDIAHVDDGGARKFLDSKGTLFIDHHQPIKLKDATYCNPRLFEREIYMPVSYIVYKLYESFGDPAKVAWISGVGVLSDHGVSVSRDLFDYIKKIDPRLVGETDFREEDLFSYSVLGTVAKILDSARVAGGKEGSTLAARTLAQVKSYKSIINAGSEDAKRLMAWSDAVRKEFKRLVADFNRKKHLVKGNIIFYEIPSKLQIKSSLSGYLVQFYRDKVLVLAQKRDGNFDVSFRRGDGVKTDLNKMAKKAVGGIPGSEGGGHEAASGARIPIKYLARFLKQL